MNTREIKTKSQQASLPYAFPDLIGTGGIIKQLPEDFKVSEVLPYTLSGTGDHHYAYIEKSLLSTSELIKSIQNILGIENQDIGFAGLKDVQGITRQWISVKSELEPEWKKLESGQIRIIENSRHTNKLKTGHIGENRFSIKIRKIDQTSQIEPVLSQIKTIGFPNYYGLQRFGRDSQNHLLGRKLLLGEKKPKGSHRDFRFLINAYQSFLFNQIISLRLEKHNNLTAVFPGDLANPSQSRGVFLVDEENLDISIQRSEDNEISMTAPMFGYRVRLCEGIPGGWERELLTSEEISLEHFRGTRKKFSFRGERRNIRAFPKELTFNLEKNGNDTDLNLSFSLGSGIYATSLLRELMKVESLNF